MLLLLALLSLTFAAQQQTGTICERYAAAKGLNQTALMTEIVTAVVGAELGNPTIEQYFNGTVPAGSTNFETDTQAFNGLAAGLVAFFGDGLGCNDATFPSYGGSDMHTVHKNMPISRADFDLFNDIFIATAASYGVAAPDQTAIRTYLDGFASAIVNPTIICGQYATALNLSQIDLMTAIVTKVVGNELANADILPYFNGEIPPGSTNFTAPANVDKYNNLATSLVAFFGGALGCDEAGFPVYGGADMKTVHQGMMIDLEDFTTFNDVFIVSLNELGVSAEDQLTVRAILDSFQDAIVNPAAPVPTPVDPPASAGFAFMPSLLLALCVMLFL